MKKIWIAVCTLLAFISCSKNREHTPPSPNRVKAETFIVKETQITEYLPVPGRVKSEKVIKLASKTQGLVKRILVKEGDRVKKGQLLIVVDDKDIRNRIKALKALEKSISDEEKALAAQLEYAHKNFLRFKRLLKHSAATQEEYDRAKSSYLSLKHKLQALKLKKQQVIEDRKALAHMLKYTRIQAPEDGVVAQKLVDEGTFINPGTPLMVIDSDSNLFEFVANVDAQYISRVMKLNKVFVDLEGVKKPIEAQIKSVSPSVDPATNTFKVRLSLKESGLHSGMFGRMLIPIGTKKAVLVPQDAIINRGNIKGVYLVDSKNVIHFQIVRLGYPLTKKERWIPASIYSGEKERWYEVLSGLKGGDRIIRGDLQKIREGDVLEQE